jgi:hypothetical protein
MIILNTVDCLSVIVEHGIIIYQQGYFMGKHDNEPVDKGRPPSSSRLIYNKPI